MAFDEDHPAEARSEAASDDRHAAAASDNTTLAGSTLGDYVDAVSSSGGYDKSGSGYLMACADTPVGIRERPVNVRAETRQFFQNLNALFELNQMIEGVISSEMPNNALVQYEDIMPPGGIMQDYVPGAEIWKQLDVLYARAREAKPKFDNFCRHLVQQVGLDPNAVMLEQAKRTWYTYTAVPLKTPYRAAQKAQLEYEGDTRHLGDIVRASVVVETEAAFEAVVKCLNENYVAAERDGVRVVRFKNPWNKRLAVGRRDVLYNISIMLYDCSSRFVCELQLHMKQILNHTATTHGPYEYFRSYYKGGDAKAVNELVALLERVLRHNSNDISKIVTSALKSSDLEQLDALDKLFQKLSELQIVALIRGRLVELAHSKLSTSVFGTRSCWLEFAQRLGNLATALLRQGKYDEAKPLYERSLRIQVSHLGEHHPDIADVLHNLAILLKKQGKYDEAKPLYERSLQIQKTNFGISHPKVAMSLNNLANLLYQMRKYGEAKLLYEDSLRIQETNLGKHHPDVADALHNLANVLNQQGNYDEAKPLYERSLRIQESTLGEHHPDVAYSLAGFALLLCRKGKYDEAKPLYERSLRLRETSLGEHHPDVAHSLNNLANVLYQQGKYDEAKLLYERSLRIRETELGEHHPLVAYSLIGLANLLKQQGEYDKAKPLYERSLRIRETKLGQVRPDVATSLDNLANVPYQQGKSEEAKPLHERSLRIRESHLDGQHRIDKSSKLTQELRKQAEGSKAEALNEEAFREALRPGSVRVAAVRTEAIVKHALAIVQELEYSDFDVRLAAEESPEATAQHARQYVQSLLDTDSNVRRAAIETLGKLPDAMAQHAEAIVQRLEDSDSEVRQAVVQAFMSLDDSVVGAMVNAIAPLVKLVKSGTDRARADAASALGCLAINADNQVLMASAIPPLVELVKSGTNRGKQAAAFVLLRLAENDDSMRAGIADAGAIMPLIQVVKFGPDVAMEKAAKVLWSLAFSTYNKVLKARAAAVQPFVDPTVSGTEFADWVLTDDVFLAVLALISGDVTAFTHIHPSIALQLEDVTIDILRQLEHGTVDNVQRLMLEKSRALFLKAAVKNGVVPWRRTKLMIVGPGRAGKTCLLKRLIKDATPVRNQRCTVGVELHDIHDWCKVKEIGQEHLCGLSALLDPRDGGPGVSYSHKKGQSDLELPSDAPKIVEKLDTQPFQLTKASTSESPFERAQPHQPVYVKRGEEPGQEFETLKTTCDISETVKKIKNEHIGIRMRVWDFSGHEVFHAVHTKFLTRNGIYIVVFNMADLDSGGQEKARALEKLAMWFHSIAIHAPGAPVFVVGTHGQRVPKFDVETMSRELEIMAKKVELRLQRPLTDKAFYAVDSIEDPFDAHVYAHLKKAIELSVMEDPQTYVSEKLPLAWLQTYDELQCARMEKRMYFTKVSSIANLLQRVYDHRTTGNHQVSDYEIHMMLDKFAKLGIILHFGEAFGTHSERLVVLDPQWLLDMFAVIVRDLRLHPMRRDMTAWTGQNFRGEQIYEAGLGTEMWEAYALHGVLYYKLLEPLWPIHAQQVEYDPAKQNAAQLRSILLTVMESLKLIVKLPPSDQNRYLVPNMLPLGTVSSASSHACTESDSIVLNFLPAGLFSRLLATLVACSNLRTDPHLIFRSTACFTLNGTSSFSVHEHRFEKTIYVLPRGNEGKSIVVNALSELSRLFYSEKVCIVAERIVSSLPSHLDAVAAVDEPVPMLMGESGGNGGKPNSLSHRGEFNKLAGQIVTKIQQMELSHWLTDHLDYEERVAELHVETFSKKGYYSIEGISCLDDTDWEELRKSDHTLNAMDKKVITEHLRSFTRPRAKKPVFALYISDSDETFERLHIELEGLLRGFTMRVDLSRPPVFVKIQQADEWNALRLAGKLYNWLEAQPNDDEVVVHVAFHNCTVAIDAKDKITEVQCESLSQRNHAFVLNWCASYRSQDHVGTNSRARCVIAWEGDVDAKTLCCFNEAFYAKFVHDYPSDDVLRSYLDKMEKMAPDNQVADRLTVKSFAGGIHQLRMRSRQGAPVLVYGGREIWRHPPAPASRIQCGQRRQIEAPCCDERQYADLFFELGPLEDRTNGQGPMPLKVDDIRSDEAPVLCLITTRPTEYRAVRTRLQPAMGRGDCVLETDLLGVSMLVGRLGEYPAALFQTQMGESATEEALGTILPQLPSIRMVVAIGFGYGLDPAFRDAPECRQMIGDVMVSAKCVDCSHIRASNDANYSRGDVTSLTSDIARVLTENVFDGWSSELEWESDRRPRPPRVQYGTYLSGLTLIDDPVEANKFKSGARNYSPIGGDMELFQIVKAARKSNTQWLAIKAISDFAGLIPKTKDGQELAAATAADFACYIFKRTDLFVPVLGNINATRDFRWPSNQIKSETGSRGGKMPIYVNGAGFQGKEIT